MRRNLKSMFAFCLLLILLVPLGLPALSQGAVPDTWYWSNPQPQGNALSEIAFGNGTFVAAGSAGTILTSANGAAWTIQASPVTEDLSGIIFANGTFVAVGAGGKILTSPNGTAWTSQVSGVTKDLLKVAFGNGKFVAVGSTGTILTSTDGVAWAENSFPFDHPASNALSGVAFGNGTFVAVGLALVLTSPDGVAWTSQPVEPTLELLGVASSGTSFVAVGKNGTIMTSANGSTWTSQVSGTSQDLFGVGFVNNSFLALGGVGTILSSPNGTTWTAQASPTTEDLSGAAFGAATFAVVGASGTIMTSSDAVGWALHSPILNDSLFGVASGGTTLAAAGSAGTILTSTDTVGWTPGVSGITGDLFGITYASGKFLAVGSAGAIVDSLNGVDWLSTTIAAEDLHGVAFGSLTFVAVGSSGAILISTDGDHWTRETSGVTEDLFGVTYGNNLFVAVGAFGTILTSADGVTWSLVQPPAPTAEDLFGVAFGGTNFVAVGGFGTILTSADGATWSPVQPAPSADDLFAVSFGVDSFVAVGGSGTILTSPDGLAWTPQISGDPIGLFGVASGASGFTAVGSNGAILQSFVPLAPIPTTPKIRMTSPLPAGTVGIAYSLTLQAIGGSTPYSWTLAAGALPAGLSLSPAGLISGTPTTATPYTFTLQLADFNGLTSQKAFSVTINTTPPPPAPMIASTSPLPSGEVGKAYSFTFQAISGTAPYTWSVVGALPPGLTLTAATGLISGTPTTANPYAFTIRVTDSNSLSAQLPISVTINAAPVPVQDFDDVPMDHQMFSFIEDIYNAGVTGGCSATSYCPDAPVTRAQMAVFIITSLGQGTNNCTGAVFTDVNAASVGAATCGYIERFSANNITAGCGNGNFCPNAPVSRGQMAVFIETALGNPPNNGTGRFTDVPASHPFCGFVERLADDGITAGCAAGTYCVDDPISRAQMAVYLVAAPAPFIP